MDSAGLRRRQLLTGLPAAVMLPGCTPSPGLRSMTGRERSVAELISAQPTVEGAGVKLHRSLGSRALPMLDPFLLLDEIHTSRVEDYIAGFPTHPHRGFETVTYMIDGAMDHQDSLGNHGHLGPGSAQWMTAGHGIVHSEMPQQERGLMWGFQLWVNLPSSAKMKPPRYQDIPPQRIALVTAKEATVRLVAGDLLGQRGPVDGIATAPNMLDVQLPPGGHFEHTLPPFHNAFAYVMQGDAVLGSSRTVAKSQQIAVLGPGDFISASSQGGARLLLLSAQPIGEPVARYGPFVMNTDREIEEAIADYRSGRLVGG